ncbi:uncharacterized protein LOC113357715 isoform X2 [Papaver somniferum]|uniref:uncharacterized protein LOC113357715 isoform X2 n=1 Tax=Papaver somniferum TaxID=3469 RepID=UPI000E6FC63E|nr:uncharacterized protein LOC113357715 isoform X2 [Papaver somniferum]
MGDSYTSHTFQSSFMQMFEEFKDIRRTWNQINLPPNVSSFVPSETYDSVFRPVPDRTYDLSPIQREETWSREPIVNSSGKRVNIKKLFRQYEQLEEEGATEDTLQAISRAIHMEVNRCVDNGEEPQKEDSDDGEPLENIDTDGDTSSTHDHNGHSHIQKEEVESRNITIIDDSDLFSDEEDLVIEETNECLAKSLSENDDTCDVGMEVSSSTEDPVIQEAMQDC